MIEKNTFPTEGGIKNFVFIGEEGCGKSEVAVNLAFKLLKEGKSVTLFDLDMTKPLFRIRDKADTLAALGITLRYEEQFADAPTTLGGVRGALRGEGYAVCDVGGDYRGARALGEYAALLNGPQTAVYYIINPYRPWSTTIERIDMVLGQTLGVSHIKLENLHLIGNPNLGGATTSEDVIKGTKMLTEMVSPYKPLEFICVDERLVGQVEGEAGLPVFGIGRFMAYSWETSTR